MNIVELLAKGRRFIERDLWQEREGRRRSKLWSLARIVVLTVKGFTEERATVRASALTYFTLLSIVPVIALAFAIAKGFGLENTLANYIRESLDTNVEIANYLIEFSGSMLNNAKGGIIAGVGIIMLLYSVFKLLSNIEDAFNRMWCIKNSRPLVRKVTDYVSIMIFSPILLLTAGSATVFVRSQLQNHLSGDLEVVNTVLLTLTPYLLMWITFSLLYLVMPNTKVQPKAAIISGIITGTAFQVVQWVYITFQIGVNNAGAVYGGFAFLPLFLAWLQLTWTIVLAGCKIAFSIQNVSKYSLEHGSEKASEDMQKKVAVLIMARVSKDFAQQRPPTEGLALANEIEISQSFFYKITEALKSVHLLTEVATEQNSQRAFVPAIDINAITLNEVCSRLATAGDDEVFHIKHSELLAQIEAEYAQTRKDGTQAAGETPLYKL